MGWKNISDEIRRSLDAFGPARTLDDVSLRTINRLIMLKLMKGVVLDRSAMRTPLQPVDDPRYRFTRLDEETLRPFACAGGYELSEHFLREAFARSDECYGFLCDGQLAAFTWYTTQPTQDAQLYKPEAPLSCMPVEVPGPVLHFSDRCVYIYKGFTRPEHRGHQLHRLGMASALPIHLERGRLGMISYVDLTGYVSRNSAIDTSRGAPSSRRLERRANYTEICSLVGTLARRARRSQGTVDGGVYTAPDAGAIDTVVVTDEAHTQAGSQVLVVQEAVVLKANPSPTDAYTGSPTTSYGAAFDGTYLYFTGGGQGPGGWVERLDADNNLAICATNDGNSGGDMLAFDGTYLYALAAADDGMDVYRWLPSQCNTDGTLANAFNLNNAVFVAGAATNAAGVSRAVFDGLVADGAGHLYLSSSGNGEIFAIDTATKAVSLFATPGGQPTGVVISRDGKTLYTSNFSANTIQAITIPGGVVTTLAGAGGSDAVVNGPAATAQFAAPSALATDGVYVYAFENHAGALRQIHIADGYVTTLAGFNHQLPWYTNPGQAGRVDGTAISLAAPGEGLLLLLPGACGPFAPGFYFGAGTQITSTALMQIH